MKSAAWVCECGHYNTGFADACYGGCGKDRPGEVRSAAANSRRPISGEEQDALEASVLFGGAPSTAACALCGAEPTEGCRRPDWLSCAREQPAATPLFPTRKGWLGELDEIREELDEIAASIPYQDVPELVEEAARRLGMACDLIEAQDG